MEHRKKQGRVETSVPRSMWQAAMASARRDIIEPLPPNMVTVRTYAAMMKIDRRTALEHLRQLVATGRAELGFRTELKSNGVPYKTPCYTLVTRGVAADAASGRSRRPHRPHRHREGRGKQ